MFTFKTFEKLNPCVHTLMKCAAHAYGEVSYNIWCILDCYA